MRTIDQANYAANRTPENRRIYAEQQVVWFYAELLKALWQLSRSRDDVRSSWWSMRLLKSERDLAEAHARLDSLTAQ